MLQKLEQKVSYCIVYAKDALKDIPKLKTTGLLQKMQNLIALLKNNPSRAPHCYVKLVNNLNGLHSRRINVQHCLVYQIYEEEKTVKIISMWSLVITCKCRNELNEASLIVADESCIFVIIKIQKGRKEISFLDLVDKGHLA